MNNPLPIRGSITVVYISSILIAGCIAAASLAGLLARDVVYPRAELVEAFLPNDVVNLAIGAPILLGSMAFARRGALTGLLCWVGALFFVLYNYQAYVLALPLSWAYLLHIALVALSAGALAALLLAIDGKAVSQRLAGRVPEKLGGGILAGLGLLFLLRAVSVISGPLAGGTPVARSDLAVSLADLFITPAWILAGVQLWRRKSLGYAAGLGLLFQASLLFLALIVFLAIQPLLTAAPLAITDIVVVLAMGLVCFVPLALFLRGASRGV